MNIFQGLGSHPFLFLAVAFSLGFITAIPIGACQIEVMKRALHNHMVSALAVVLGSTFADLLYGAVAFLGLAPFLHHAKVIAVFDIASAPILFLLAWLSLRQGNQHHTTELEIRILKSRRISFLTGFLLGIANPLMLFWWLLGAKIVLDLGLVTVMGPQTKLAFLAAAASGLTVYLSLVALLLHFTKHMISAKTLKRINVVLGLVLAILGIIFLVKGLKATLLV